MSMADSFSSGWFGMDDEPYSYKNLYDTLEACMIFTYASKRVYSSFWLSSGAAAQKLQ